MMIRKAVVTGGSGLVGHALLPRLPSAVVLSRDPERAEIDSVKAQSARWDPDGQPAPREALSGADTVFHLAGESVAGGRWTDERKKKIRESRVVGTRNLVAGLAAIEDKAQRPKVLVCASAIGYYGDRGDELLDERSAAGSDFLAEVCVAWEREAKAAEALGIRVVCVRTGIVLSARGGALAQMLKPFKLGAGGKLGSGEQWMSWIHIDDLVGLMLHAAEHEEVRGPMNAAAPHPVRNAEFTKALGHALHRPAILPVPKLALRVAFGEMSQVMLASQRVESKVAASTGYAFQHPELAEALSSVLAAGEDKAA
jgi:uncharacterized protein